MVTILYRYEFMMLSLMWLAYIVRYMMIPISNNLMVQGKSSAKRFDNTTLSKAICLNSKSKLQLVVATCIQTALNFYISELKFS